MSLTTTSSDATPPDRVPEPLDLDAIHAASCRGPLRVLVLGTAGQVDRVIGAIRADLPAPVRKYQHTAPHASSGHAGTVIVPEIARLTPTQQEALMHWMTDCSRESVVTLSSEALWPRVVSGEFRADLFYRLNVITIDLTGVV